MTEANTKVGVVGVGSMGRNHVRVYRELPGATLVGIADADAKRARQVASDYDTRVMSTEALLAAVDAVSIAVPTAHHYELARAAIDDGVHVLVEKPFVDDLERGRELVERADARDVVLQVGHVERFNPAVAALGDVVHDLDIIAVDAQRLGPPVNREIVDDAVLDLMIHDIDVLQWLVGRDVAGVAAMQAPNDAYVTATVEFDGGIIGTLTASRVTQQKVRRLSITARTAKVNVDYISQSVTIHRHSLPEYVETNGDVRFRHENIVERPTVQNGEPLKKELAAFVEASATGTEPVVTGEDGLRALAIARRIRDAAATGIDHTITELHP